MSTIWDEILKREEIKEEPCTRPDEKIPESVLHSECCDCKECIPDRITHDSELFEEISAMDLVEFQKRNMALQIYSEYLNCEIWLCSNTGMQKQIKNDDPEAITYTVDELKNI